MADHSRSMFSTWVSLFLSLGSLAFAYIITITATTMAQPSFIEYMHLDTDPNANQLIGAANGVTTAGALIGALVSPQFSDVLGRRAAVATYALSCIISGAFQAGSVNMAMFIASRLLAGLGIGGLVTVVPLFQSEISPPKARGLVVGLHGVFIALGSVCSSWAGFGFYFVNAGGSQWRVPLALQCVPVVILCVGVWLIPESPRWLVNRNRMDEALQSLIRFHRTRDDPDNIYSHQEFLQIKAQHDEDEENQVTWLQMFTVPSYRKRALLGFFICGGSMFTATMLLSVYGPILYSSLGYDTKFVLLFAGLWSLVAQIGNTFCAFTVDRMGRVRALQIGWIGCGLSSIAIIISLAKFEESGTRASAISAISFIYLEILMYASFVDPTVYIYSSEIFPNNVRGKGMAISTSGYFAALVVQLNTAPVGIASMGWKLILIWLCLLVVAIPFLFIVCPETKGKSLEEIGVLFRDRHINAALEDTSTVVEETKISGKQATQSTEQVYEHVET